jgi:hypothetical protein
MATTTKPQPLDSTGRSCRHAEQDLAFGATVDMAQFRADLQGFPEARPWGRTSAASPGLPVRRARMRLSQQANQDLETLFGLRALPRILAALDQLAITGWDQADWGGPSFGPSLSGAISRCAATRCSSSSGPRPAPTPGIWLRR